MLSKVMEEALNGQVRTELESAYIYLSMSAYCEAKDHLGFARWLRVQAREELTHAMRFFDFINDRGGRVILQAMDKPHHDFGSMIELFKQVLQHEVKVTASIHRLYELAEKEKDYASIPLIESFIVEQVEEEKSAADALALITRAGEDAAAIIELNRTLGQRPE